MLKKSSNDPTLFTESILAVSCFLHTLQSGSTWALLPNLLNATEQASRYGNTIGIASAIGLILSFVLGRASDSIGRLWSYRISVVLASLSSVLVAIGCVLGDSSTHLIVWGALLSRVRAPRVIARAFVVDFGGDRTLRLARQGALSGFGFVVGPSLGGWLSTFGGTTATSLNAGICLLNCLLSWFVLRDLLVPVVSEQEKEKEKEKERVGVVVSNKFFFNEMIKYDTLLLCSILFCLSFGFQAFTASFAMYCKSRFDFGPLEYGRVLSFCGVIWCR